MDVDKQAYSIAVAELSKKFSWQAYVLMASAEYRMSRTDGIEASKAPETDRVPDSKVDESIDSFAARFADYADARGKPEAMAKLEACLSVAVATMSELLSTTSGDERSAVAKACRSIGSLAR